jgi:hypothetical protein
MKDIRCEVQLLVKTPPTLPEHVMRLMDAENIFAGFGSEIIPTGNGTEGGSMSLWSLEGDEAAEDMRGTSSLPPFFDYSLDATDLPRITDGGLKLPYRGAGIYGTLNSTELPAHLISLMAHDGTPNPMAVVGNALSDLLFITKDLGRPKVGFLNYLTSEGKYLLSETKELAYLDDIQMGGGDDLARGYLYSSEIVPASGKDNREYVIDSPDGSLRHARKVTQAEYDAMGPGRDPHTIFYITD